MSYFYIWLGLNTFASIILLENKILKDVGKAASKSIQFLLALYLEISIILLNDYIPSSRNRVFY